MEPQLSLATVAQHCETWGSELLRKSTDNNASSLGVLREATIYSAYRTCSGLIVEIVSDSRLFLAGITLPWALKTRSNDEADH